MENKRAQDWQGRMLDRYRLIRMLGKGGMGEVWLGEDTQLRRQVAVKLLPTVHASDENYLRAFAYEARAAAALEHPNILPVHDFGEVPDEENGVVTYLIMPYMAGGSLKERIHTANGPLPVKEALQYLRHAALAIDYAHSQQVLHRDIKPANMLLQNNWLFLADFGIAKLLSSSTYRSQTYAGAGTPEYMAPEQAQGHAEAASDRYSLAMIAYQMFTGKLPFRGDGPYEVLLKQLQEQPEAPRKFNPTLSLDIEQIILRGLAKPPAERPPSCIRFVEVLERAWQTQILPPQADEDATVLAPWSKRLQQVQVPPLPFSTMPPPVTHQTPLQIPPITETAGQARAASGPVGPISGVNPYATQVGPISGPSPYATQSGPISGIGAHPTQYGPGNQAGYPQAQGSGPGSLGGSQPLITRGGNQSGNMYNSFNGVNAAVPINTTNTTGSFHQEVPIAERASKIKRRNLLIAGGAAVVVLGGGAALASSLTHPQSTPAGPKPTPTPIPGPQRFMLGVAQLSLTGHSKTVWDALWHPSGRYLATAGEDGFVMIWDVGTSLQKNPTSVLPMAQPLRKWKFANQIYDQEISWSPDGQSLLVSALGTLYRIDVFGKGNVQPVNYKDDSQSQSFLSILDANDYHHPTWSPKGGIFVTSVGFKTQLVFWDVKKTNAPIKTMPFSDPNAPTGAALQETAWSKDGSMLASLTNYGVVAVWDNKTSKVLTTYSEPDRTNNKSVIVARSAFSWSPADTHMFLAADTDVLMIYDVRKDKPLFMLGTDDPDALTIPQQKPGDIPWVPNVTGAAWSANGRYIAAGYGRSGRVHIWDLQNTAPKVKNGVRIQDYIFPGPTDAIGHNGTIMEVSWSPDGRYIATGSGDTTVIVWKVDRA